MNNKETPSTRTVAMPSDTNPSGDIFGGWLLSQMDIAGAQHAYHITRHRVVTVAVEAMTFHKPVKVGDEVSCFCETVYEGKTSLGVYIETWVRRRDGKDSLKVTEGKFTYVTMGEDNKPLVWDA